MVLDRNLQRQKISHRPISAVMPAYNEEENIEPAIRRLAETLQMLGREWELIVVDDGSTDATKGRAETACREYSAVRVVAHPENRGYGAALRTGFAACRHPLVFYTDSDRQFEPNDIHQLLDLIDEVDIVCGYRLQRRDGLHRRFAAWLFRWATWLIFSIPVRDVDCAFKLFRRGVLRRMVLQSNAYFVDAEILAKATYLGYLIAEVGVQHFPRVAGQTKVNRATILRTLREALTILFRPTFVGPPPAQLATARPKK